MKVGSLVECVNNCNISGNIPPKLNKVYTVREIGTSGRKMPSGAISSTSGIYLEEIVNFPDSDGDENGYLIHRFRELLPPMSITIEQFEYEKA